MKRYSNGDSPGKWKRIIGPVDDSDSSSSSSFEELYDQHLCDFRPCVGCKRPRFICKCASRINTSTLMTSASHTPQFTGSGASNDGQASQDPINIQPGPSGYTSRQMNSSGSHISVAEPPDSPVAVSFRAATSIQPFTERNIIDFISKRRLYHMERSLGLPRSFSTDFPNHPSQSAFVLERRPDTDTVEPVQPAGQSSSAVNTAASQPVATEASSGSSAAAELELLHSKLIGLLECPVCLEPIVPPIHQCRRGHLICSRCKPQLNSCPTCRDRMSDSRNIAVERIAEQLRYPCKNSTSGCLVKMPLNQKEVHEDGCTFRTFTCPFRTCTWTGFLPELKPHLRLSHATRYLEGAEHQIDVELNSPTLFYTDWAISCLNEVFRLNVFQNIPNSMVYASCYFLGAPNRASDFAYTISMAGSQNRRITYTRQTHVESTKITSLCASSDCFVIKGDVVKYFVSNGGKLKLKVNLEQLPR